MKVVHLLTPDRQPWLRKPVRAGAYQPWLIDTKSLTARLQTRYTDFKVKPVQVQETKPVRDETRLLCLALHQRALIREVLLMGNHQPVVFAHSVLPRRSYRGIWRGLGKLGNKPLGATLFANPKVKRTPLRYKKLSRNHPLYGRAIQFVENAPDELWARRSIFSLNRAKILVTEVFLPELFVL